MALPAILVGSDRAQSALHIAACRKNRDCFREQEKRGTFSTIHKPGSDSLSTECHSTRRIWISGLGLRAAFDAKIVVGDQLMQMARREHASDAFDLTQFVKAGPLLIRGRRTPIDVWALRAEAVESLLESAATPPVGVETALYPDDCSV